jgi:hypothetical protein
MVISYCALQVTIQNIKPVKITVIAWGEFELIWAKYIPVKPQISKSITGQ